MKANAKTKSLAKPRGHEVEQICLRRDAIFFFRPLDTRVCLCNVDSTIRSAITLKKSDIFSSL